MKSRLLHNLILALIVAGLALFLIFKPQPAGPQKYKLSMLTPSAVTRVELTPAGKPTVVLEKKGDDWRMTAPLKGRADSFRIDGALDILSAESETKLPAKELEKFELDKPYVRLKVNGQEFLFGGRQPVTDQIYVATGGRIYLVAPVYLASAAKSATDFLAKQILGDRETPRGFELPGLKLTQNAGKWVREPDDGKLSADQLNRFADEWKLAMAMSVSPAGETQPKAHVGVILADGKHLNFGIVSQEPDVVLRREDEKLDYHFTKDAGEKLLDPAKIDTKQP
jgi:hypothetical protein